MIFEVVQLKGKFNHTLVIQNIFYSSLFSQFLGFSSYFKDLLLNLSKNYAVVVTKAGEVTAEEVPVAKLRDDYILVKVKAVALNPTDWKHVDFLTTKGARVGDSHPIRTEISEAFQVLCREHCTCPKLFKS